MKRHFLFCLSLVFLAGCQQADQQQDYQQAVKREQVIAKTNPWHAAKLKGASFRAIGQEPAWLIEFYPGDKIALNWNYGERNQNFKYPVPATDKANRRSVFQLGSQGKVIVEGKLCTDTMSGEKFETSVTVFIEEKILHGCGKSLY